ncbi:WG repeat-containing protein [Bradyrhizobium sp. HKCCYLS20291]
MMGMTNLHMALLALHIVIILAVAGIGRPAAAVGASPEGPGAWFDCGEPGVTGSRCASRDGNGQMLLQRSYRARLRYDRHGLAVVRLEDPSGSGRGGWFYARRDGSMAEVMTFDNGPDAFVNGRARAPVGAKIGYVDRALKRVIPAKYDGAYPFENGIAVVCIGCSLASKGEHSWFEGGTWGCIDPDGKTVAPFKVRERPAFADICRP